MTSAFDMLAVRRKYMAMLPSKTKADLELKGLERIALFAWEQIRSGCSVLEGKAVQEVVKIRPLCLVQTATPSLPLQGRRLWQAGTPDGVPKARATKLLQLNPRKEFSRKTQ